MRVVLALPVLLAACVPGLAPRPTCDEALYDTEIGRPLDEIAVDPALTTRVIRPGEAVTEEFSADRLNIEVDGSDRAVRFTCG